MRKLLMVLLVIGLITGILAGCGGSSESQSNTPAENVAEDQTEQAQQEETAQEEETHEGDTVAVNEEHDHDHEGVSPTEPGEGEMCSMCDMIVYHQDHEMGKFTGQVVTADGEHLFTDDVGCLLNQIRILEEEPQAAWVRDYNTLEWVPVAEATPVRASIETPMKMGFALFASEEDAVQYATENPSVSPVISTMDDVDKIALDRRNAKMAKMKEAQEKQEAANNMNH